MAPSTDDYAERFVDGADVKAADLAKTVVMSSVTGLLAFYLGIVDALMSSAVRMAEAIGTAILGGIDRTFGIPVSVLEAGAAASAEWISIFGPAAFPVAIALVAVSLYALGWGISEVLKIV